MQITYFIFLLISIVFRLYHLPGTNLLLIISIPFLIIDIVIQTVREKGDMETNIFSAFTSFILAFFLCFKFLSWPGSTLIFLTGFIISLIYLYRIFKKNIVRKVRFYITISLFIFSTFNFILPKSTFTLFYLLEDPFNEKEHLPNFIIQKIAFNLYHENQKDKAVFLINRNIRHQRELLKSDSLSNNHDNMLEVDNSNLMQSIEDLKSIQNNNWNYLIPLFPEDRVLE
jgi:hypothetical protein